MIRTAAKLLLKGLRLLVIGLLLVLSRFYQWVVSPLMHMVAPGCGCRFYPTCSQYAREAVVAHGPIKGCWLSAKRIARCHPWGGSGIDLVPPLADSNCTCASSKAPKGVEAPANFHS